MEKRTNWHKYDYTDEGTKWKFIDSNWILQDGEMKNECCGHFSFFYFSRHNQPAQMFAFVESLVKNWLW